MFAREDDVHRETALARERTAVAPQGTRTMAKPVLRDSTPDVVSSGQPSLPAVSGISTRIQRRAEPTESVGLSGGAVDGDTEAAIRQASAGGSSLPGKIRSSMEGAFGADFSGVRVHSGEESAALNSRIQARAFTVGNNIFFKDSTPDYASADGQRLLAHELTHTLQQGGSSVQRSPAAVETSSVGTRIQRDDDDDDLTTTKDEVVDDRSYMRWGLDAVGSILTWSPWKTGAATPPPTTGATTTDPPKPGSTTSDPPKQKVTAQADLAKGVGTSGKGTTKPTESAADQPRSTKKSRARKKKSGSQASTSSPVDPTPVTLHTGGGSVTDTNDTDAVDTLDTAASDPVPESSLAVATDTPSTSTSLKAEPKPDVVAVPKPRVQSLEERAREAFSVLKPQALEAIEAATVRNLPFAALRGMINKLDQATNSRKTQWGTFAKDVKSASTAKDELLALIATTDQDNATVLADEMARIKPYMEQALIDATTYKLDATALTSATQALAGMPSKTALEVIAARAQIKAVREALTPLQAKVKPAKECAAVADTVLPVMKLALEHATAALDGDEHHARDNDYWKELRSAEALLLATKQEYETEAAKAHPDWVAAQLTLQTIRIRSKRVEREIAVAPSRPDNLVGWNTTSDAIGVQNPTAIQGDKAENEQASLTEALAGLDSGGSWDGGGGKWGTYYGNQEGRLPSGSYAEYYVRPPAGEASWGRRRLVREAKGRTYYTWTHYGDNGEPNFVLLRP